MSRALGRRSYVNLQSCFAFVVLDVTAASLSAMVIYLARQEGPAMGHHSSATRSVLTVLMPVVWVLTLALHRAYDRWSLHSAPRTARRVPQAALTLIAAISSVCLARHYTAVLDEILFGIPLTAALTIVMRRMAAWWSLRHGDAYLRRALVVGYAAAVGGLLAAISRDRGHNIQPVATCVVDESASDQLQLDVPVLGGLDDICGTALAAGCNCVIMSHYPDMNALRLRQLGWTLHTAGIELLVAPALPDVAERWTAVRPAGDLPLLLPVQPPVFSGPGRLIKGLLDWVGALVMLVCLWPAMLVIAVLVRATSPGPALFCQRRVGRNGKEFTLVKFRTMTEDAETRRAELLHLTERQEGLQFKIRADPRVTRVGRFLRKHSLDELPQLINVLTGDMSLVGPRPPLPHEVANYDDTVWRRMRVKPGLTGLWQVSGRSELSWEDSVRLDLSYVDNWSPTLDARILLRTVAAFVRGTDAPSRVVKRTRPVPGMTTGAEEQRAPTPTKPAVRMTALAVRILPSSERARYAEEFHAELTDLAGQGDLEGRWEQLAYSLRLAARAWSLRRSLKDRPIDGLNQIDG